MCVDSTLPTALEVSWKRVPPIDHNGLLLTYEIKYEPLQTFAEQITTGYINTTGQEVMNITLADLQEFVKYNISIRAYTGVGAGPFTAEMTQRTREDGMFTVGVVLDCTDIRTYVEPGEYP